ncbi:GSCFA domain-containing protein [Pseudofulvibacter geojedonensis]|uniref:GSCFA domain-containing protein n=1 Tax=Pseudofulvibacter geojedonensis TaxID=1123758 RepID=A0ABW3I195_9FLAO
MNFRTQIPIVKQSDNLIDYHSNLLLLGSCFSENIGEKLSYFKFQSAINPFGILFHPKAIETFLERVINQKFYSEEELIFQNEQYHCLDAHSSLSNTNKEDLLNNLSSILISSYEQISNTTHLIITLGTAWVYEYIETGKTVANCHKIPQKEFNKRLLSVEEIKSSLLNVEKLIRSVNSKVQLIYTVSPVRHIKDGFVQNKQSKAHLLTAIHQTLNVSYFPSYEIMMDELRDYRFYKEDMIHPNQIAVDYIWKRFVEVWVSEKSLLTMKEIEVIQKGLAHKPFNPQSQKHQLFLENIERKIVEIQSKLPNVKF